MPFTIVNTKILIVDDDKNIRESLSAVLERNDYQTMMASTGKEALRKLENETFTLLITDLKLPDTDGISLHRKVIKKNPQILTVIITGHASVQSGIEAMKDGAYDYIKKPFRMEEMLLTVRKALEHAQLRGENIDLREKLRLKYHPDNIVGRNQKMLDVFDIMKNVAVSDATILLRGESGTGKELVARAIHHMSRRKEKSFVPLSCGALPETLLESELFGHEKGAFTGATSRKPGVFEIADGGTLFLDEIGDLSPATQVKLLRVLQEKEFQTVGGVNQIKVDVRLISATNTDLEKAVKENRFREDLYYRINVVQINIPALRDRKDDIPLLVHHFIKKCGSAHRVSEEALELLVEYDWPGNVRELENIIERASVLTKGELIKTENLTDTLRDSVLSRRKVKEQDVIEQPSIETDAGEAKSLKLKQARGKFEKDFLGKILGICRGNVSEAARKAGISRKSFYEKVK